MSNTLRPGSSHEHHIRLSSAQREAILRRFAPRFTVGQPLADRAAHTMHGITQTEIEPMPVATPPSEETQRTVGSNAISMEAWRRQQEAAKQMGRLNLHEPDSDASVYNLDDIRATVQNSYAIEAKSYPMEQGNHHDQEAA